jgi:hypothetical protein
MERKTLSIFLITVVVLSVATLLAHNHISELQEQLNELQKPIDDARKVMITEFSSPTGWWNPVGVAIAVNFNVTILNTGINDVEGIVLEIKTLNFDEDTLTRTRAIGMLHAGETTIIQDTITIGMQSYLDEYYNSSFVATLKLGNIVLDNRTLQITERQF